MAVTFEQARSIALTAAQPGWKPENGTLIAAEKGFEDADFWQVVLGPAEWLNDRDPDFELLDVPATLVNKRTGALVQLSVIENLERLGNMTPV